MSPERLPGLLLVASLAAALASGLWRARRWRAGRPVDVDLMRGLAALPKRYLVDVHAVVLRDPPGPREPRAGGGASARMHVLTAGGLVLATPLALLQGLTPLRGPWLAVGLLAALAMMAAGVALVAWRRWPARPARLSGGAFDTLPWALGGFVAFLLRATCSDLGVGPPVRWTALPDLGLAALGVWACAEIFTGVGWGPMRHALAGALHLAFHPRPARFDRAHIDAALRPLALDSPRLGVQSARDFRWNELLGFDACVQCGRCEAACPAFAAGQPLNPKALIRDLASAATHGTLIGSGAIVEADTLWACTTCRACVSECPMMIEHVDAVVDLRRFQTLELGATPGKAVQALQELRATDTVCGRSTASRLDWAADLKLRLLAPGASCDVLLWLGEAAFDLRGQRTLRALVQVLQRAAVDFAVLGADELDCGDLARRLGDEATFAELARRNVETLAKRRFARIRPAAGPGRCAGRRLDLSRSVLPGAIQRRHRIAAPAAAGNRHRPGRNEALGHALQLLRLGRGRRVHRRAGQAAHPGRADRARARGRSAGRGRRMSELRRDAGGRRRPAAGRSGSGRAGAAGGAGSRTAG